MCGQYYIADYEMNAEIRKICEEIRKRYPDPSPCVPMKTGEIYPTNIAPVIIADQQSTQPVLMTWGYPKWTGSGVVINARAETAAEKPMFKTSVSQRRCIIPSNGFFEWDHTEGHTKSKFLLHRKESSMLYMAGLYSVFEDKNKDKYSAYVILTVNANATVSAIHDRMPLVVDQGENDRWLHDEKYARSIMITPCLAEMVAIKS